MTQRLVRETQQGVVDIVREYGVKSLYGNVRNLILEFEGKHKKYLQAQIERVQRAPYYSIQSVFEGKELLPLFKNQEFFAAIKKNTSPEDVSVGLITYHTSKSNTITGLIAANSSLDTGHIDIWYAHNDTGRNLVEDNEVIYDRWSLGGEKPFEKTGRNSDIAIIRDKIVDFVEIIENSYRQF